MSFEPKNFFVGLVDFFSVLLPGAAVTYLGRDWVLAHELPFHPPAGAEEGVAVFLFVSYVIGHCVFLIGSAFVDEVLYAPMRDWTDWGQVKRLAKGEGLSPSWCRSLALTKLFFGPSADAAVACISRHKARALQKLDAANAINSFQWSKARLSKENPEGLGAVQRFEADSKFFRSFTVVSFFVMAAWLASGHWMWALTSLGFMLLAFVRYVEQRFKATQQAYWNIMALDGASVASEVAVPVRLPRSDELTHAGGVVYKTKGESLHFLLVTARKDKEQLVLPKGHLEPGESPKEAAVREVREESGHWAKVLDYLIDVPLTVGTEAQCIRFYLMEALELGASPEGRTESWITLQDAQTRCEAGTVFREVVQVLRQAEERLISLRSARTAIAGV